MSARRNSQRGDSSPFPSGPLLPCRQNPAYLSDADGKAVFLCGSHSWAVFQERGIEGHTADFDFDEYLDMMASCGHNYLRLWTWEHCLRMQCASAHTPVRYKPLPWQRTGPGEAVDGLPKFDLSKFYPEYFERLRNRVVAAGRRGIYVSVMFFQGFSLRKSNGEYGVYDDHAGNAWDGHPFNRRNNINGIHGESDNSNTGHEVHTLSDPEITRLQETFIRKVVDTLADLDYVFWEVANESEVGSVAFQYHIIRYIRDYQQSRDYPSRAIGMSGSPIDSESLFNSPADWISPPGSEYLDDPPPADGAKAVIIDSDHCGPWRFDPLMPWRALLRGYSFCAMDPWRDYRFNCPPDPVDDWGDLRRSMGAAVAVSERIPLNTMRPAGEKSSSGYCLSNDNGTILALRTEGSRPLVLSGIAPGSEYELEWIHCISGRVLKRDTVSSDASGAMKLNAPYGGPVAVIAVTRK